MKKLIKSIELKKEELVLRQLSIFGFFLFVVSFAPILNNQLITGLIVNTVLFTSVFVLGLKASLLIAVVPSLIALSVGLLPMVLLPIVPFIIIGNIILVFIFNLFSREKFLGIILASILKSSFIFISSLIIFNFFIQKPVFLNIYLVMGFYQLFTSLIGGFLFYLLIGNRCKK